MPCRPRSAAETARKPDDGDRLYSPRTLCEACRRTGCDEDSKRCPTCPLKNLCGSDDRWLVRMSSQIHLTSRSRAIENFASSDNREQTYGLNATVDPNRLTKRMEEEP